MPDEEWIEQMKLLLSTHMGRQIYKDLPTLDEMLEFWLTKLCEL